MPTTLRNFPSVARPAAIYNIPQAAVGQFATSVELAVTRSNLPAEETAVGCLILEGSDDSGATWKFLGATVIVGGVSLDRFGQPRAESIYSCELPASEGAYLFRGRVALIVDATAGMRMTVYP